MGSKGSGPEGQITNGAVPNPASEPPCTTMADFIAQDERLKMFRMAVEAADLGGVLSDPLLNVTLFVPADEAFTKLEGLRSKKLLATFLEDPVLLNPIISYHVASSPLLLKQLMERHQIETLVADQQGGGRL